MVKKITVYGGGIEYGQHLVVDRVGDPYHCSALLWDLGHPGPEEGSEVVADERPELPTE